MEVRREDIPDDMLSMVDIIGIDKFLDVSKIYGGYAVYIPIYKSIIREARNREIMSKYDGYNVRELANIYGISANHIYHIVKNNKISYSRQITTEK